MAANANSIWATGRRKTAVARVRMIPGSGSVQVNERSLAEYFCRETLEMVVNQPFEITGSKGNFDVSAKVHGGGVAAQAQALRLGIARALIKADGELRGALKKAGFLTRDARTVERKKYGHHKARKSPQFSKR